MIIRRERIVEAAFAVRFGGLGEALTLALVSAPIIGLMGLLAYLLHEPLLFPSLGPTIYLCFSTPLVPAASPRNTIIGHGVGIASAYLSLVIFGQLGVPNVLDGGMTPGRIGAAALAVALTGAVLLLLRAAHPPAGATTLIVSLGLLATPHRAIVIFLAVALLTAISWAINRARGVPVPRWAAANATTALPPI